MACDLKLACNFFFSFLQCSHLRDTIDIELTVRTVKEIHIFRKDQTVKTATRSPLSRQMKLFPSLQKKIEAYKGEKREERSLFHPNLNPFTKRSPFSKRSRNNVQKKGKSKNRRLNIAKFDPPKTKRPANLWVMLPSTKSMNHHHSITTVMASICRTCKRWGLPSPFCSQSAPHPSPVESDWSDEDWNRKKQRAKKEEKRKQDLQAQQKEEDLTKDYCSSSPAYDTTFKQDPLPYCTPKEKMAPRTKVLSSRLYPRRTRKR